MSLSKLFRLTIAASALLLAGCGTSGVGSIDSDDIHPRAVKAQKYRVDTGDFLLISVDGYSQIDNVFPVNALGDLNLPTIGDVTARGSTLEEIAYNIENQIINASITDDPIVSVEVVTLRGVYIHGKVGSPGKYDYVSGITVGGLVSLAGGVTANPEAYVAKTIRSGPKGRVAVGDLSAEDVVLPGDLITIE